ncbi:MAG: FAD-binding oxidoreductase [Myxococcaceae bacterium]
MIPSFPASSLPPPSPAAMTLLPELQCRTSASDQDRLAYSRDNWTLGLLRIRQGKIPPPPDLVAWPKNEEELVQLIRAARARKVPVIPFGGGSGVVGGTWALNGGIAVDCKRLEAISAIDRVRREVTVQAGVFGEVLERKLNAEGFTLGHMPIFIRSSTVGGWLASRSAGFFATRYGKIEDLVVSLSGVTGTGERFTTPRRPHEGPDLAALFMGSEGTLCTFTEATLRVQPYPEQRLFRAFRFKSVEQGVIALRELLRAGLRPAAARLYDPFDTAVVRRSKENGPARAPSLRNPVDADLLPALMRKLSPLTVGRPSLLNRAAHLFRESLLLLVFEGERHRTDGELKEARTICERLRGEDEGEGASLHWFEHRFDPLFTVAKLVDSGAFTDTMEVSCSWDKALDVYERVRAAVSPLAFVTCHLPHAYLDGCSLQFTLVASSGSDDEARYAELWRHALTAALSAGASLSHHHGIGALKSAALKDTLGDGRRALVALKRAFDPDGIMNPGKLSL